MFFWSLIGLIGNAKILADIGKLFEIFAKLNVETVTAMSSRATARTTSESDHKTAILQTPLGNPLSLSRRRLSFSLVVFFVARVLVRGRFVGRVTGEEVIL